MTIGEQIKVARKRKGIRQQQLAGMIGTKASIISRYEHGDILPPVERLVSISEVLETEFVISCGVVSERMPSEEAATPGILPFTLFRESVPVATVSLTPRDAETINRLTCGLYLSLMEEEE